MIQGSVSTAGSTHMTSSRRLRHFLTPILCCTLLCSSLVPPLARNAEMARGQGGGSQAGRGRKVRPEPPRPGAPAAAVPNLDDARQRTPIAPHTPFALASTLRSRHKPLESRRGRRVGDPLPTPTPAAPTPTPFAQRADGGGTSPMGLDSSNAFAGTDAYALYFTRFLVSPSYDQLRSFSGSVSLSDTSFDFFALSMLQAGGGRVVFSSNRDGNMQVYSMNSDGSGQVRLTSDGGNDDAPR